MGIGDTGYGRKTYHNNALTATKVEVTQGEIKFKFVEAINKDATDAWLQIFNKHAADVTVGTTVPDQSFLVPAGDGTLYGAMDHDFDEGLDFDKGLTIAFTTTEGGNTATTTAGVVNIHYLGGG